MGRLIRYELRKLFLGKFLYVITAIFTIFPVLRAITKLIAILTAPSLSETLNSSLSSSVNSLLSGFFALYVLLVGAWIAPMFISPDYSNGGMLSNVVSKGYTRVEVFVAKYISLIVLHIFAFAVSFIIGFIVGLPFVNDTSGELMSSLQIDIAVKMLIACFATLSLQVFFSVACKKKTSVFLSVLVSNPIIALIVCFVPLISRSKVILWISKFIQGWYVPFAYIKAVLSGLFDSAGISPFIKIDFEYLILSSIILFVLSFGGSILVVSRKEISK